MVTKQPSSNTLRSRMPLRGQVALVTGATRGIGLAIARALAGEGCNLIVTARSETALARVSRELASAQLQVVAHSCDVGDPRSVDALFRAARQRFKRLDILINNAGITHANLPVEKLPFLVWKDVLQTNLNGMFLVTQAALALMKRGATIVNNLSIAATRVLRPADRQDGLDRAAGMRHQPSVHR